MQQGYLDQLPTEYSNERDNNHLLIDVPFHVLQTGTSYQPITHIENSKKGLGSISRSQDFIPTSLMTLVKEA